MTETDTNKVREEILDATVEVFNEKGLKFTMDILAARLHRSKKTIYVYFPDKQHLLDAMVDYIFDSIKQKEQLYFDNSSLTARERLINVLGAMPERFQNVDFSRLYILKEKYPGIYERVQERLESGWEQTFQILEEGMKSGEFRRISLPVFKTMMQATLEQFFQRDVLVENKISYKKALTEVVGILVDGVVQK